MTSSIPVASRIEIHKCGPIVCTQGVMAELDADQIHQCVFAFLRGDFGQMPTEDIASNHDSLRAAAQGKPGGMVMGKYTNGETDVYVICSGYGNQKLGADYCNTTVLLTSEY